MKLLKYFIIFFLVHCGWNQKKPVPILTSPIVPTVTTKCYSSRMDIAKKSVYKNFLADTLGRNLCCQTGKVLGYATSWQLCFPNNCDKWASNPPDVRLIIESGYKKIKNLSFTPRGTTQILPPPLLLNEVAIEMINRNRGWQARFYAPPKVPGAIGSHLNLKCERCEFEDENYTMDIDVQYRDSKMGTIHIVPSRPSTNEQCEAIKKSFSTSQ